MRGIVQRLTEVLKAYDPALYAYRNPKGVTMVMRKADRLEASDYGQEEEDSLLVNPQLVFSLTEDWTPHGKPVEYGIEPVMSRLREIDMWRCDKWIHERKINRRKVEEEKERHWKNEFRAIAADSRKEFARATNDINTSSLDMTDARKKKELKNGYRK